MRIDTGTDELLCELRDRVATVTLNKPEKRNALGDILTPALREVLLRLEADPGGGCVLITGAGKAFCAGGDVSEMGGRAPSGQRTQDERVAELTRKQGSTDPAPLRIGQAPPSPRCPAPRPGPASPSRWPATSA